MAIKATLQNNFYNSSLGLLVRSPERKCKERVSILNVGVWAGG